MKQDPFPASADSEFRMIDVSSKIATDRRALAEGRIYMQPSVIRRIRQRDMPKGDVLALAEVAGIMAAKNTSQILPLCHPLQIDSVRIFCQPHADHIHVGAEVRCHGKTGVEMEALCAVHAALLCIYDLSKIIEPEMTISDVRLLRKEGGKSGVWEPAGALSSKNSSVTSTEQKVNHCGVVLSLQGVPCAVVTVSDRCSQGVAKDSSGPAIISWLQAQGALVPSQKLVADEKEEIQGAVRSLVGQHQLIILTGGTGLSPRDVTPESLLEIADREIVGFGELLRSQGARFTPMSYLSRSIGVLVGNSVVLALPGSQKAVLEGLGILEKILPHALHIAKGGPHGGAHVS